MRPHVSSARIRALAALLLACGLGAASSVAAPSPRAAAQAPERTLVSGQAERQALGITIYNQGFGLVREQRNVELGRGRVKLDFADVAATIQPETVHIRSLDGDALRVLEQNYQYDLLNPQKLLEKYVGRQVRVVRWNDVTGRDDERPAEVLAANQGAILKIDDQITFDWPGRILFPEIPENLIARPTLSWQLESGKARQQLEVSYLASALDWRADYVFAIDADDAQGDLVGWVTLTNQSGASYADARLKLVAGDVQRVTDQPRPEARVLSMRAQAQADFAEEAFFEYHLYTLDRPTTVRDNEQKQVTLLESSGIAVQKKLILRGQPHYFRGAYGQPVQSDKIGVYLDFRNSADNRLGMPLPKGIVRVYKADSEGALQFVGEDRIDHTPRDEEVRIKTGDAFDVVAERRQMDFETRGRCGADTAWEVELRNRKDEAVTVEVFEPVSGEWEILESSHSAEKIDARTFRFTVQVPAGEELVIRYTVRARWC